jgi:4-hydroxy-tetrahydrodipicolinate synthase
MPKLSILCRNATTFSESGGLDEDALRQFLQRFVDANIGVYLGSGGSGEGHALSMAELRRVYQIGVEVCRGRIPVYANQPEQHTAKATLEHALLAIETGVDAINLYAIAGLHGMRPKDPELLAYYEELLSAIKHPVVLSINPIVGYIPTSAFIAKICCRFPQIIAVNLTKVGHAYLLDLKRTIDREVSYFVDDLPSSLNAFILGANGLTGAGANILPKTYRLYLDLFESRRFDELATVYQHLLRFGQYVNKWSPTYARSIKMAMKVLKLPGGKGGLRRPYLMPDAEELQSFTEGLLRLGLPEIEEQARAAGLRV